jgi:hypothetical protein
MKIVIEAIPQAQHRYDTWGDWWFDPDGTLQIRVSNDEPALPTENHQFLVALHELVEVMLCKERGITQQQVDEFDFENQERCNEEDLEPGDLPGAPYRKEHRFAMIVEHLMAKELGIDGYGVIK